MEILDNNIAYMKVPEMAGGEELTTQGRLIDEFYTSIADCDDLIIDITGNAGGTDLYWFKNIVIPNIEKSIEVTTSGFIKNSSTNLKFVADIVGSPLENYIAKENEIDNLPNINSNDLYLSKIYKFTTQLSPLIENKKKFNGTIYVLIDGEVYSSAESFAMFCKQSGFAKVVGTPSKGDGGGFMPIVTSLPNSGIVIRYSIFHTLNHDGSGN